MTLQLTAYLFMVVVLGIPAPAGATSAKPQRPLKTFVSSRYYHGTDYDAAHAYGPKALPELKRMLADPAMKEQWRSIVTTIAYIGAPESFHILKDFMWHRFTGTVDDATWGALLNVPNVMGTIPDTPGAQVSNYLAKGVNPAFWDSLPWQERVHSEHFHDLSLVMSISSINGLGCTGTPLASEVLGRLSRSPYHARQRNSVSEAIDANQEVAKVGRSAYIKHVHARLDGEEKKAR